MNKSIFLFAFLLVLLSPHSLSAEEPNNLGQNQLLKKETPNPSNARGIQVKIIQHDAPVPPLFSLLPPVSPPDAASSIINPNDITTQNSNGKGNFPVQRQSNTVHAQNILELAKIMGGGGPIDQSNVGQVLANVVQNGQHQPQAPGGVRPGPLDIKNLHDWSRVVADKAQTPPRHIAPPFVTHQQAKTSNRGLGFFELFEAEEDPNPKETKAETQYLLNLGTEFLYPINFKKAKPEELCTHLEAVSIELSHLNTYFTKKGKHALDPKDPLAAPEAKEALQKNGPHFEKLSAVLKQASKRFRIWAGGVKDFPSVIQSYDQHSNQVLNTLEKYDCAKHLEITSAEESGAHSISPSAMKWAFQVILIVLTSFFI